MQNQQEEEQKSAYNNEEIDNDLDEFGRFEFSIKMINDNIIRIKVPSNAKIGELLAYVKEQALQLNLENSANIQMLACDYLLPINYYLTNQQNSIDILIKYQVSYLQAVYREEIQDINNIQLTHFSYSEYLAKGATGQLFLMRHKQSSKLFVLKMMDFNTFDEFLNERYFAFSMEQNKNTLEYYGTFLTHGHFNILMEYIPFQNLEHTLKINKQKQKKFTWDDVRIYFVKIFEIVYQLNKKNILFNNLKLSKFLIDMDGNLKLCGLGQAKKIDNNLFTNDFVGLQNILNSFIKYIVEVQPIWIFKFKQDLQKCSGIEDYEKLKDNRWLKIGYQETLDKPLETDSELYYKENISRVQADGDLQFYKGRFLKFNHTMFPQLLHLTEKGKELFQYEDLGLKDSDFDQFSCVCIGDSPRNNSQAEKQQSGLNQTFKTPEKNKNNIEPAIDKKQYLYNNLIDNEQSPNSLQNKTNKQQNEQIYHQKSKVDLENCSVVSEFPDGYPYDYFEQNQRSQMQIIDNEQEEEVKQEKQHNKSMEMEFYNESPIKRKYQSKVVFSEREIDMENKINQDNILIEPLQQEQSEEDKKQLKFYFKMKYLCKKQIMNLEKRIQNIFIKNMKKYLLN